MYVGRCVLLRDISRTPVTILRGTVAGGLFGQSCEPGDRPDATRDHWTADFTCRNAKYRGPVGLPCREKCPATSDARICDKRQELRALRHGWSVAWMPMARTSRRRAVQPDLPGPSFDSSRRHLGYVTSFMLLGWWSGRCPLCEPVYGCSTPLPPKHRFSTLPENFS